MSLGISQESIGNARKDLDKYMINPFAERENNIANNDGMTLRIPQENSYDRLVNSLDSRRIKLEKRTEILHDYYGDRLLAKDLFKDYLSYKNLTGGVANILSLGLLGANLYTKVMKNSVLLGKFGALAGVLALQAGGRYLSNNWLEEKIARPWKIHTNRMSKGLGPTNIPSNYHDEIITSPLRFAVYKNI